MHDKLTKMNCTLQLRTSATQTSLWNDPTTWAISGFDARTAIRSAPLSGSPGGGRSPPFLNQKRNKKNTCTGPRCCNAQEWMKHDPPANPGLMHPPQVSQVFDINQ